MNALAVFHEAEKRQSVIGMWKTKEEGTASYARSSPKTFFRTITLYWWVRHIIAAFDPDLKGMTLHRSPNALVDDSCCEAHSGSYIDDCQIRNDFRAPWTNDAVSCSPLP